MKKTLIAMLALIASAGTLCAQQTGVFNASDFGAWGLSTGVTPANGMLQWSSGSICQIFSGGYAFTAARVGRPLTIVDGNTPAFTETVIPTAVTITANTCTIAAPMTHIHYSYTVKSGTAGLQEAIDYSSTTATIGGAVIQLTPSWSWIGGQTSMLSLATGQNGTSIVDARTAVSCGYIWNGSAYASSGCGGSTAAILTQTLNQTFAGPITVPQGITANLTGAVTGHSSLDVPLTRLVQGHNLGSDVVISASEITTGQLPHAQLPTLLAADIPNNTATAGNLTGNPNLQVTNLTILGTCTGACGNSGIHYTTPTLYALPVVSDPSGSGSVINSTFVDDVANGLASVGDAFTMKNAVTIAAQGVANNSQNYPCNPTSYAISYYNAGTIADAYTIGCFVNPGTAPTTLYTIYGPSTLSFATANTGVGLLLAQNAAYQASVGNGNLNSPKFKLRGATRNSSGLSQNDDWNLQAFQGTGNQPISTFTFTHTGSTGKAQVEMPGLIVDGTPYFASGVSTNTDVSGELVFSTATTASYTFANTYIVHPECWIAPQFDIGSGNRAWVTYTGVTSMTINFSAAVTGTVSFGCVGRS